MGAIYIVYPAALYFGLCTLRADAISDGAEVGASIHQYSHVTFGFPVGMEGFPSLAVAKYQFELAIILVYTLATWWDVSLFYCTRPGDLYKFWAALVLWETASTVTSPSSPSGSKAPPRSQGRL